MTSTNSSTATLPNERKEVEEVLSSRPVEYYLKHRINEKLIEGLVDNNRFNDSLSRARVGKVKGKTYNLLPQGLIYEAILKKKITKKEDVGGNFEIPYSIGGLKHVNALVDQGYDVNIIPYSTYMKLNDEMPAKTDIKLSLASHSYIYPLGIAEDVLVEVAEHVYPVDFVILDIKENEKRPFILGTSFLTMAKTVIKFDKGTITLRSGKGKISFHRIPDSPCMTEKGEKTPRNWPPIYSQVFDDESAQAEELMQTAKDLEESVHQEFETGVTKDQPDEETSQLPDGFIYNEQYKKNRLMRIDELYKFSDDTPNDVWTALNDSLKGIQMKFYTLAGNPVKEILLKLNLPDHRIRKDGGDLRSDEVLKLKNFKKDATLKLFKSTNQERCSRSHSRQAKEQAQDLKSMITTSNHKIND
ncbi:zinc finger, CCHC-type containing protein [Tanacetum coccineum]